MADVILGISVLLQFGAAILALRLIGLTERRRAWLLIAAAVSLMAVRRSVTLFESVFAATPREPAIAAELIALLISVLMVAGIAMIGPIFERMKQTQSDLAETQARFQSILDNTPQFIFVNDLEGRHLVASQAMLNVMGMDRDEYLGKSNSDLLPGEAVREFDANDRRVIESRQAMQFEEPVIDEGGITHTYLSTKFPLLDAEGEPYALCGIITDITDRKQMEEELRLNQRRLAQAQRTARIGSWEGGQEGRAIFSDESYRILGWDPAVDEPTTEKCIRLMHEDDRAPALRTMVEAAQTNDPFSFDFRLALEDGTEKVVCVIGEPAESSDAEGRYAGTVMDVTERHAAEQERRELQAQMQHTQKLESLGVLAGGIAHDFNNLLVAILGNADLALSELSPASPGRECLGDIVDAAQRAAELCRQMLAYSGRGQFVVQYVNMNEVVREMAHLIVISISKSVKIDYDLDEDLPAVEADVTQMRQVILNLITNASDAIGEARGRITLATGSRHYDAAYLEKTYLDTAPGEGDYVFVEVSDTGCGMDEETRAKIFDPFFTTKFTGRGLGLAAALGIVGGHHGALEVESEPGRGTKFRVLLPASANQAQSLDSKPGREPEWLAKGVILVVDDEPSVLVLARRALERVGFEVITATDGDEGVRIFGENPDRIDAVVLDVTMPRMGGREAFEAMRKLRPEARVLLSSGYDEAEATERFEVNGLAGFIQKPYRASALAVKIRDVLRT